MPIPPATEPSVAYELRRFATNIRTGLWPGAGMPRNLLATMLVAQAERLESERDTECLEAALSEVERLRDAAEALQRQTSGGKEPNHAMWGALFNHLDDAQRTLGEFLFGPSVGGRHG